jgi:hypothetical protein
MLVAANKELYVTLPKKQKLLLSMSIVNAVRSQSPPGRFLQKDANSELYYDVGDQRAQEKTSQALREGAPIIKKKIAVPTLDVEPIALPKPPPTAPHPGVMHPPPAAARLNATQYPAVPVPLPPPVPAQGPVPSRTKKKGTTTTVKQPQVASTNELAETSHASSAIRELDEDNDHAQYYQIHNGEDDNGNHHASSSAGMSSSTHPLPYHASSETTTAPLSTPPPVDGGLEPSSLSFGTYMSIGTIETSLNTSDHYYREFRDERPLQQQQPDGVNGTAAPVDGGLESSQGVSFGTAVMSVDSLQLERAGISVGSVMSLNTMPAAVDGGLEGIGASFGSMSISQHVPSAVDGGLYSIGMSFGSLSLTAEDRTMLINSLREDNIEIPAILESTPTFLSAQRSTANLLECSDTDSDEESRKASSAHPSADWEKLQATLAAQNNAGIPSSSVFPPPLFPGTRSNPPGVSNFPFPSGSNEFYVPTTGFDRDLSALSVGDFEPSYVTSPSTERDRQAMPPPANRYSNVAITELSLPAATPPPLPLRKDESNPWEDVDELDRSYLAQGNSLSEEFTNDS